MVEVFAIDKKGNCRGDYNPTEKENHKLNFEYVMEDTKENRSYILGVIENLAFGEDVISLDPDSLEYVAYFS